MNASPVTQAGSDRPDRKKSMRVRDRPPGHQPDAQDEDEVDGDERVVDPVRVDQGVGGREGERCEGGDISGSWAVRRWISAQPRAYAAISAPGHRRLGPEAGHLDSAL